MIINKIKSAFNFALCCVLLTALFVSEVYAAEVETARLWRGPDKTRLVFDLSGPIEYEIFTLQNPERLVIDIANSSRSTLFDNLKLAKTPILKIRAGIRKKKNLRIVLDLADATEYKHFVLGPNAKYGDRLVIDLVNKVRKVVKKVPEVVEKLPEEVKKVPEELKKVPEVVKKVPQIIEKEPPASRSIEDVIAESGRKIIIAVDAGHGGVDPGALGPKRIQEKKVVLQISQRLEKLLDDDPYFDGLLIREGDYYLAHRKRTQKARDNRADFFVSIHADAFTDSRVKGASVYALSNKGATSETARYLAKKENEADLIGGGSALKIGDKDSLLAGVLVDLSMNSTLRSSLDAGDYILRNMGTVARLHKKKVEQASFLVLKSLDIPSLLIETGFISNPNEARKLSNAAYQRKLAKAIYVGLVQYYHDNPPDGTLLASAISGKTRTYLVAKGDTLSEIAIRHNTSVGRILSYNKLSSSAIHVGQELLIPAR
jgi:N-acetylmuramoyl-L-alanine amidase